MVEPDTGMITDCALTKAAGPDPPTPRSASTCSPTNQSPRTSTGNRPGWRCSPIPPTAPVTRRPRWPRPGTPRSSSRGRCARRPGRVHPRRLHRRRGRRHGRPARTVSPGRSPHPPGHLRGRLPRLPAARPVHHQQRRPHPETPHHDALYRAHRRRAETPTSKPFTAGTGPWSNAPSPGSTRGNRRLRYRGIAKNDTWLHHRVAGLNLRRLLALGLTRDQAPGYWPDQHPTSTPTGARNPGRQAEHTTTHAPTQALIPRPNTRPNTPRQTRLLQGTPRPGGRSGGCRGRGGPRRSARGPPAAARTTAAPPAPAPGSAARPASTPGTA